MSKRIIFVDLDETLWHSTTAMWLNRSFLLPDELIADSRAERDLRDKIEKEAKRLLNEKGLVEGTFEFERSIHDTKNEVVSDLAIKRGWKEFWFGEGEAYLTKLRPKALEFLKAISKLGELHVCTSSTTEYATLIIKTFKLDQFFKTISARENIKSYEVFNLEGIKSWVLVDDLHPSEESISRKMRFISGAQGGRNTWEEAKNRVVRVPEFLGNPMDDGLMDIVEEVEKRLCEMELKK